MTKKKKLTEKRIKMADSKPTKHKLKTQYWHFVLPVARLERVLSDKIQRPEEDLRITGGPLVEAILQLLNTEPATAAPRWEQWWFSSGQVNRLIWSYGYF